MWSFISLWNDGVDETGENKLLFEGKEKNKSQRENPKWANHFLKIGQESGPGSVNLLSMTSFS